MGPNNHWEWKEVNGTVTTGAPTSDRIITCPAQVNNQPRQIIIRDIHITTDATANYTTIQFLDASAGNVLIQVRSMLASDVWDAKMGKWIVVGQNKDVYLNRTVAVAGTLSYYVAYHVI